MVRMVDVLKLVDAPADGSGAMEMTWHGLGCRRF